jgi:hypothetical protein
MAEIDYGFARQRVEEVLSEFLCAEGIFLCLNSDLIWIEIIHEEYASLSVNSTSKLVSFLKESINEVCVGMESFLTSYW